MIFLFCSEPRCDAELYALGVPPYNTLLGGGDDCDADTISCRTNLHISVSEILLTTA